ncbi:uncharacterized protein LOC143525861 isoform X2 [Brachyhypopomus gauderio]|uniref:uncharacterized protein LOC143525861 isoform X2 n=1 Tax=Brachyhypopomus gauderio TaxID=698409 RepID=UPI004042060B
MFFVAVLHFQYFKRLDLHNLRRLHDGKRDPCGNHCPSQDRVESVKAQDIVKFRPNTLELGSPKRRMVSTALCGRCGAQGKVLTHVLLSVLLAYLVTLGITSAVSSNAHIKPTATANTTTSPPTSGPTNQTNTSPKRPNTTSIRISTNLSGSPPTSGITNQTAGINTTTMMKTSTATTKSYSTFATTNRTYTSSGGINSTTVMKTSATTNSNVTSGTTNQTYTSSGGINSTTVMNTSTTTNSYYTSGTTNQTYTSSGGTNTMTVMNTSTTTNNNITSGTTNQTYTSSGGITTTTVMNTSTTTNSNVTSGGNTTTVTTTSITTASIYSPTGSTPPRCNFSQQCDDLSVYYWMTISVELIGTVEADITAWLWDQFQNHLSECNSSAASVLVSSASVQNNNSLTATQPVQSSVIQKGTTTNIFKNIEVMCDIKPSTGTQCSVVLQLTKDPDKCCIVRLVENNFTMQAHMTVDQIERVAKGFCVMNATAPPIKSFEKCNGSLNSADSCNSSAAVDISCGQSETLYVSLGIQDWRNCSSDSVNKTNTCYCSAYCNSPAAYYSLKITITGSIFNDPSQIRSMISQPTCHSTNPGCQALQNISTIYEDLLWWCETFQNVSNCSVIVKLKHEVDICSVSLALMSAFQNQSVAQTNGHVTRAAICSWENKTNIFLQANVSLVNLDSDSSNFCKNNPYGFSDLCVPGTNAVILLSEECSPAPPTSMPSTNTTTVTNATMITPNNVTVVNITVVTNSTASTNSNSTEAAAEGLKNLSNNASSLSFAQLENIVSQLESLLANSPSVSQTLGVLFITTVSNLLDAPPSLLASMSKRIIGIVDTVGLKLVVQEQKAEILTKSLALGVKKVDGAAFPQTTFTMIDSSNLQINSVSRRNVETTLLSPQGSILLPASLTQNLTAQQQQMASRVQFSFYQKSTLFQDKSLNPNRSMLISEVLSASVANLSISHLTDKIIITLRNINSSMSNMQNYTASCVFWDFNLNGGSGGWSSEGCSVLNSTDKETVCSCNHLTGFGVLLNIFQEGPLDPVQALILTYITYIGCGISAIFLSVTLLTYLSFEKLRKDIPSKILIHLCLALLMLNLVFLLDSWLSLYTNAVGLCISTAFFLHYFLLASFTWMALEAVHMYIALVKVFNTYVSRFMIKLGFAGWGIPLIVVIIVISIKKDNYGLVSYGKVENGNSKDFCWIKDDIAFYVAVVAYFCVVFMMNLIMFIVVMIQLCRIKKQNPHSVQHRSALQEARSVAGLTVLLGLTWGFAFFAWGVLNLPFMFLFAIFNSLQGFFIFVFHCAVKDNVRRQWRTYLCCGKFRLAENSDWSHTATQRTKKFSVNRVATSFRSVESSKSNNSSSSTTFLVSNSSGSDSLTGISNPLDDTALTAQEERSSDVALNEINHRFRDQRSH